MSRHDLLLEWASEKGSGSWAELRAAWQWISARDGGLRGEDPASRAWITAADLAALAHIEISWDGEGTWSAAPPVITMLPNSGGRALLTGSRTRALYRPAAASAPASGLLAAAAEDLDLWIDDLERGNGPISVVIACENPEDAATLAARCGIGYSYSVSQQLSAMLPPLSAYERLWRARPVPQGFPTERFDATRLEWVPSSEEETAGPGLYRCITWREHVHVLTTATGATLRAAREHAVYEVLHWKGLSVLGYDPRSHELWVPVAAPLPLMHARTAVLCSGQLPHFRRAGDAPGRFYVNVTPAVAERIAQSLSQELP